VREAREPDEGEVGTAACGAEEELAAARGEPDGTAGTGPLFTDRLNAASGVREHKTTARTEYLAGERGTYWF
jgi:hypothetical protein